MSSTAAGSAHDPWRHRIRVERRSNETIKVPEADALEQPQSVPLGDEYDGLA